MIDGLAEITFELGRVEDSERWARNALEVPERIDDRQQCVFAIARLAVTAAATRRNQRAGRLWGAVEAEEARGPLGVWRHERDRLEAVVLAHDDEELERGKAAGRSMSLDEAIDLPWREESRPRKSLVR